MGEVIRFPSKRVAISGEKSGEAKPAPLWREAAGRELREERQAQERTLADVAGEAGVSTQYLSEVERGRKEPSSEIVEAISGSLGLSLLDLTTRITQRLRLQTAPPRGPVALAA
jgi:transcriptional regulator with XRE-family HTH domain